MTVYHPIQAYVVDHYVFVIFLMYARILNWGHSFLIHAEIGIDRIVISGIVVDRFYYSAISLKLC